MKLTWRGYKRGHGMGPKTTKEMADQIRQEGKLGTHFFLNNRTGLRCAHGVVYDFYVNVSNDGWSGIASEGRWLTEYSERKLVGHLNLSVESNDAFEGTPEERATYIADLWEAIP